MTLERSKPNSLKLSNLNLLKNNLTLLAGYGCRLIQAQPLLLQIRPMARLWGKCR